MHGPVQLQADVEAGPHKPLNGHGYVVWDVQVLQHHWLASSQAVQLWDWLLHRDAELRGTAVAIQLMLLACYAAWWLTRGQLAHGSRAAGHSVCRLLGSRRAPSLQAVVQSTGTCRHGGKHTWMRRSPSRRSTRGTPRQPA